jgi:hypothetical protein
MKMRFDVQNQLSVAQAFTGSATVSTNSYDLGTYDSNAPDPSIGRRMSLLCLVTVAAGAGSTHTMDLINCTNSALTAGLVVLSTQSIVAATLVAGYAFEMQCPNGSIALRYIGFRNTSTGGTTTITMDVYWLPSDEIPKFKSFVKVVDAVV